MDRRFTFSNSEIISKLQNEFIPAVGNTHELQNQKFVASKWFLDMARPINPRIEQRQTAQGFYVAGADGKGYGFNNNRDPQRVLALMRKGAEAFRKNPPAPVEISPGELSAQFARGPAPGTTVLQVYSRIKPLPPGCDELNGGIGRDFFWVYPEDVASIRNGELPKSLISRLVRFHLVDNVRGEPDFWSPAQVRRSNFRLERLGGNGYRLTGDFSMSTATGARGMEGTLEASLALASDGRLARFKAFARARAWGAGTYTPSPPPGKFPLLFAIVPATADYARVTPPQAALYGDAEYRAAK